VSAATLTYVTQHYVRLMRKFGAPTQSADKRGVCCFARTRTLVVFVVVVVVVVEKTNDLMEILCISCCDKNEQ